MLSRSDYVIKTTKSNAAILWGLISSMLILSHMQTFDCFISRENMKTDAVVFSFYSQRDMSDTHISLKRNGNNGQKRRKRALMVQFWESAIVWLLRFCVSRESLGCGFDLNGSRRALSLFTLIRPKYLDIKDSPYARNSILLPMIKI